MKRSLLAVLSLLLAAPAAGVAAEHIIPAGSMIQCTVSEPRISSKTEAIGDPILCQVSHVERYGRGTLPFGAYLEGRFEDYRDPGHLVGKGWMELKFDRMIIEPDTVIPLSAKVVYVPGYPVDREGRILGKGHAVRDTVEWMLPVLWPIDVINLPRRGPRPTLKGETPLTLKVMDDFGVPDTPEPMQDPSGLYRRPSAYTPPPAPEPAPQPIVQQYVAPPPPPVAYGYGYAYAAVPPYAAIMAGPRAPVVILRGGVRYRVYIPR